MRRTAYCVILIVGLIGSLFGSFLFGKLDVHVVPDFWDELITAAIGAVVLLILWQGFGGLKRCFRTAPWGLRAGAFILCSVWLWQIGLKGSFRGRIRTKRPRSVVSQGGVQRAAVPHHG